MVEARLIALTDVWVEVSLGKAESPLNVSSDSEWFYFGYFFLFFSKKKKLNFHFSPCLLKTKNSKTCEKIMNKIHWYF